MNKLKLTMLTVLLIVFGTAESTAQVKNASNPITGEWKLVSDYEKVEDDLVINETLMSYSFLKHIYDLSSNGKGYFLTRMDPDDEEEIMMADEITWKINGNKISIHYDLPENKEEILQNYIYSIEGENLTLSRTITEGKETITKRYKFKKI